MLVGALKHLASGYCDPWPMVLVAGDRSLSTGNCWPPACGVVCCWFCICWMGVIGCVGCICCVDCICGGACICCGGMTGLV